MKRVAAVLAMALFVGIGFQANAQMDKKEAKEWKKRIKALDPEQYKTLLEENKSLKSQVSSLKNELSSVDSRIADKDDQINQYKKQVSQLRDELADAVSQPQTTQPANTDEDVGILFRVQIGAYEKKDLGDLAEKASNLDQEKEGALNKYTVGAFRDYYEADKMKKYLREMGVKDAFIVSYKDGKRVPINEVLDSVPKS